MTFSNMIKTKKVAVVGLGYVGLPLLKQFHKFRFNAIGFDIDKKKVKSLIYNNFKNKKKFTANINDLNNSNFYIICVPTPINKKKKPDLRHLKNASTIVGKNLKKGDIVVYESTVFPGCTEEFCVPILEKYSNLKINKDFYCGYSPERINPEDKKYTIDKIIKVTSGSNKFSSKIIDNIYKKIIPAGTFMANSIKDAEAAKVIENIQRDLNIALINELSLIFDKMNLDIYKILKAASTKWNFINFKPGLVGGHCIGVDPYYLTYKAQQLKYKPKVILAGRKINDDMPKEISKKVINHLKKNYLKDKKKRILILGFSFKENSRDIRNTKIIDLYKHLKKKNLSIDIYDPIVDKKKVQNEYSVKLLDKINFNNAYNAIIVAVPHDEIKKINKKKFKKICKKNCLIIDLKNSFSI